MNTKMLHDQRNKFKIKSNDGNSQKDFTIERNGALLDMLAEVASRTLHSDPSVKSSIKLTNTRSSDISSHVSCKRKQMPCRGRSGEGDSMSIEQLRNLTANHLLKLFSEFDSDEIRRTFTYTCFIEPECCCKQFSSFGSECKARQQMKSHLLEHVNQLELKAERGLHYTFESIKVRRRRLAETLHMNRRSKLSSKIKDEQNVKSEASDENDSSLPNKENNLSSIVENSVLVKTIQKVEKVLKSETGESFIAGDSKNSAEMEMKKEQNRSLCMVLRDNTEKGTEKEDVYGIFDEHNYVTVRTNKNTTKQSVDNRKCDQIMSEISSVGCDIQNQERIKQEPHLSYKLPTADLGNFMVDETLRDMVMVYVVENNQLQLKQLPCVGQEVDVSTSQSLNYKTIRSDDLPVVQDNRKSEPQDYSDEVKREINCERSIERDEYILKKKPKGKAKFIGQSKAEKEMAIHLIETMKRKGNTETLECHICNPPRSFTAPTTLISHYRSHAGIKPYECRICHSVFTRQHSLNYHMLIHTNQTRFTCADCGRKFRHPSHFKEHRRRHTGESPYECSDCMLRFKTRNTYKRHLKTRHGKVLTTSGGLIILSEEEFRQVRTLPRTPHKPSIIQIKDFQTGKKKTRKNKGHIKMTSKKRRLEVNDLKALNHQDYEDEQHTDIEIPLESNRAESFIEASVLEDSAYINNVDNEVTIPVSKTDFSDKVFQDIVEEAMRQSNIPFVDDTRNVKANVVVLDVPATNTDDFFNPANNTVEKQDETTSSETSSCTLNKESKTKEKNKEGVKPVALMRKRYFNHIKPKSCNKSLILPNNIGINPLLISTGIHQTQTLSTILTTHVQTGTFTTQVSSSSSFLSHQYNAEKNQLNQELDSEVLNIVSSDKLNVISSNSQQATIVLLTEDCTSFTAISDQNYSIKEVQESSV